MNLTPLTDRDKFELANDPDFMIAVQEAEINKLPLSRFAFHTIGDRKRLIDELEKAGFRIVKAQGLFTQEDLDTAKNRAVWDTLYTPCENCGGGHIRPCQHCSDLGYHRIMFTQTEWEEITRNHPATL